LIELRFNVPLDAKQVISETLFPATIIRDLFKTVIGMNVVWSHYTVEDSFTVDVACDKKWGLRSWKLENLGS